MSSIKQINNSQKQSEALLNDTIRRELFNKLFQLYATSLPNIIINKQGEAIIKYSIEVKNMAESIRELIRQRDCQIINSLN
jgi:hypothetical protein